MDRIAPSTALCTSCWVLRIESASVALEPAQLYKRFADVRRGHQTLVSPMLPHVRHDAQHEQLRFVVFVKLIVLRDTCLVVRRRGRPHPEPKASFFDRNVRSRIQVAYYAGNSASLDTTSATSSATDLSYVTRHRSMMFLPTSPRQPTCLASFIHCLKKQSHGPRTPARYLVRHRSSDYVRPADPPDNLPKCCHLRCHNPLAVPQPPRDQTQRPARHGVPELPRPPRMYLQAPTGSLRRPGRRVYRSPLYAVAFPAAPRYRANPPARVPPASSRAPDTLAGRTGRSRQSPS